MAKISTRVPDELREKLEREAEKNDISMSHYIRLILYSRHNLRDSYDTCEEPSDNSQKLAERIEELEKRINDLEKQCRNQNMGIDDYVEESKKNPEETIRSQVPANLVSLVLEIDDVVQQVSGKENYNLKESNNGVTYYPDLPGYLGYAFMTVQPSRGENHVNIHFDGSAKKSVNENPISNSSIPSARKIPSNWKWSDSFRLTVEINRQSDIDDKVKKAIEKTFNQLEQ
ncbi:hypothetical protein [Natronobacterium texcoconense]|uniref:Ribbon-helix-helix protein, copG family n=1 Tax=Natronobacterium texcoconense TaxID=1095778 RepID=A0A1H1CE53_NATTX|nr:hypothetical protein [Natronobacterium texcoconense]SDQ62454.1 hypothetical protein SAMN04489842_1373 [Natronobacterium texcoconense]